MRLNVVQSYSVSAIRHVYMYVCTTHTNTHVHVQHTQTLMYMYKSLYNLLIGVVAPTYSCSVRTCVSVQAQWLQVWLILVPAVEVMSLSKLHSAAEAGDLVLVKRLVVEGLDPQEREPRNWPYRTPLHYAAWCVPKVNEWSWFLACCTVWP